MTIGINLHEDLIKRNPFSMFILLNRIFNVNYFFIHSDELIYGENKNRLIGNDKFERLLRYIKQNTEDRNEEDYYNLRDDNSKVIGQISGSFVDLLLWNTLYFRSKKKINPDDYLDLLKDLFIIRIFEITGSRSRMLSSFYIFKNEIKINISTHNDINCFSVNPFASYVKEMGSFEDFNVIYTSENEINGFDPLLDTISLIMQDHLKRLPENGRPLLEYDFYKKVTNLLGFPELLNNRIEENPNRKILLKENSYSGEYLRIESEVNNDEDISNLINILKKYENFFKKMELLRIVQNRNSKK